MKKIFLNSFTGSFLFLATCIAANSQIAKTNVELPGDIPSFGKSVSENASGIVDRKNVDSKAVRNFDKSFKSAGETWYAVRGGYAATFGSNSIDYLVTYDKKGNWLHTVRTYGETKLQEDLRHAVKSIYYDYEINLVNEIEGPVDPVTYIVHLIGKTKLINLRISNGEIEEWQKFNRSE